MFDEMRSRYTRRMKNTVAEMVKKRKRSQSRKTQKRKANFFCKSKNTLVLQISPFNILVSMPDIMKLEPPPNVAVPISVLFSKSRKYRVGSPAHIVVSNI